MKEDTKHALALILAFWIPLAPCVQLHAAYYVDPANEFPICVNPSHQEDPAIFGDVVVWADWRNGNSDIYGKNLISQQEFPVCTTPVNQWDPAIWDSTVVWQDDIDVIHIWGADISDVSKPRKFLFHTTGSVEPTQLSIYGDTCPFGKGA